MLEDVNIYDLYRTNYAADSSSSQKERLTSTIVDGRERHYKRGHTIAERTPWLKSVVSDKHPMLHSIIGDGQSDYMNRADVR